MLLYFYRIHFNIIYCFDPDNIYFSRVLHTIGKSQDDNLNILTTATSNYLPGCSSFRGPGDSPKKHDHLRTNTVTKEFNKTGFQKPSIPLDGDYNQQNELSLRTSATPKSHYTKISVLQQPFHSGGHQNEFMSHKFDGGFVEPDNSKVAINHGYFRSDKYSTALSSGYNTRTGTNTEIPHNTGVVESTEHSFGGHKIATSSTSLPNKKDITTGVSTAGYKKPKYPVLIGNTVMFYDTKTFASLPQCCKYMVKVKVKDAMGTYKVKLALKSSSDTERYVRTYAYICMYSYVHYNDDC